MIIPEPWKNWANNAKKWFENQGANSNAAYYFALLYGFASAYGLQPRVTSIFRDPDYQDQLRERWDRGDRAGLRARPAENSKHSNETWLGRADSLAMDMPTNNDSFTAQLAEQIGLKTGASFRKPDPGHYYL